jgi:hypothetical protein
LFQLGRSESLNEIFVEFVMQYAITYAFAYPFAFVYFVLWTAPWTIWAYCESVWDLPTALAMWAVWAVVAALPGVGLFFGIRWVSAYVRRMRDEGRDGGAAGGRAFRQANRLFG